MLRNLLCVVLLSVSSAAWAIDPILLLLLRMVRDQVITSSLQSGVEALREEPRPPAPVFGYALPSAPPEQGSEGQHLKALIDDSFLHLTANQRAAVNAGMQKILDDPSNAPIKAQILGEFSLKARALGAGYRQLDSLSRSEKRTLAAQAKEEFLRLPPAERQQLLEVLQTGMLPMPRDLNDIMVAEFSSVIPVSTSERRSD